MVRCKLSCWGWSRQVTARPAVKCCAGARLQLPRLRVPRGSPPDVIGGTGDTRSTWRGLRACVPQQLSQRHRAVCEKAELCRGPPVFAGSSHFLSIPALLAVLPGNRGCGQDPPHPHTTCTLHPTRHWNLNSTNKKDWDCSRLRRYISSLHSLEIWFASPCREKLISLGLLHTGCPPVPTHPCGQERGQRASSLLVLSPSERPAPCHLLSDT